MLRTESKIFELPESTKAKEQERFIENNYPFKESQYTLDEILDYAFEGFQVIEKRNKENEIDGIITFDFDEDNRGDNYCKIGIFLIDKKKRGEMLINELWKELIELAKKESCEYFSAKADTKAGRNWLENNDFYKTIDEVNGIEYYRYDIN